MTWGSVISICIVFVHLSGFYLYHDCDVSQLQLDWPVRLLIMEMLSPHLWWTPYLDQILNFLGACITKNVQGERKPKKRNDSGYLRNFSIAVPTRTMKGKTTFWQVTHWMQNLWFWQKDGSAFSKLPLEDDPWYCYQCRSEAITRIPSPPSPVPTFVKEPEELITGLPFDPPFF